MNVGTVNFGSIRTRANLFKISMGRGQSAAPMSTVGIDAANSGATARDSAAFYFSRNISHAHAAGNRGA